VVGPYRNLVNFGPVALKFKRVNGVHCFVDLHFNCVRLAGPSLDTAAISTEFCGEISAQFCFTDSLGGDPTIRTWFAARKSICTV